MSAEYLLVWICSLFMELEINRGLSEIRTEAGMERMQEKKRKTILIIDDDMKIGDLEQEILEQAGYGCQRAYSGTEALLCLEHTRPDLILLDLMLPGLSGEEVLEKIQGIPVIVVSAKAGIDDKVSLLLGGAEDYITKPFSTRELLARVEVQLRKTVSPLSDVHRYKDLIMDTASHAVTAGEQSVLLTKTEYAILKLLLQNPEQVIAKSVMLDRISEETLDCTETSLKTHMSHLRSKLREAGGKEYIKSVWGIGFMLKEESELC